MAKVVDALEGLLWITALAPLWVLYFRTKMSTVATVHLLVTQWWNRGMVLMCFLHEQLS